MKEDFQRLVALLVEPSLGRQIPGPMVHEHRA